MDLVVAWPWEVKETDGRANSSGWLHVWMNDRFLCFR